MTWLPQEAIRAKRDGAALPAPELAALARGIADGTLSDAQVGAFAMAVQWRGMTAEECAEFTIAMRDTGEVFDWRAESPPGLQRNDIWGHSTNQDMLNGSVDVQLDVGDTVFLRPQQSEFVFLQFGDIAVYDDGHIVEAWPVFPEAA